MVQEIVEQLALIGLLGLLVKLTLWAQPDAADPSDVWERKALSVIPPLPAQKDQPD